MNRLLVLVCLLLTWLPALAQPEGRLKAEVREQIGVFRVEVPAEVTWKPGDIVSLWRGDQLLGEATVTECRGGRAVISLKGVFRAQPGDRVVFARSSSAPPAAAAPTPAGKPPSQPPSQPTSPSASVTCPTCHQSMRSTGKTRREGLVTLEEYTCGPHAYWAVVENLASPVRTGIPNSCPVCGMPMFMQRYQPGVGSIYRCQSNHEVVK